MKKLDLVKGQLVLDGKAVAAKPTGRPRNISLSELEDVDEIRALAEDNNTHAVNADAYVTGNARRGLTPIVAIQFYEIMREYRSLGGSYGKY